MNRDGNNARMIRRMVEDLHILAEQYDWSTSQNEQINEAAETVGALISLPDPEGEE